MKNKNLIAMELSKEKGLFLDNSLQIVDNAAKFINSVDIKHDHLQKDTVKTQATKKSYI